MNTQIRKNTAIFSGFDNLFFNIIHVQLMFGSLREANSENTGDGGAIPGPIRPIWLR